MAELAGQYQEVDSVVAARHRGRELFVAPYLGEFGWELMNWQGRVRWMVRHGGFDRVIICVPESRSAIYESLGTKADYLYVNVDGAPGESNEDHRIDERGRPIDAEVLNRFLSDRCREAWERTEGICNDHSSLPFESNKKSVVSVMSPDYRARLWPTTRRYQSFVEIRRSRRLDIDVLLVPRNRSTAEERNLPQAWWDELANRLHSAGLRVERYATTLTKVIEQLSSARLAMGASTGGLHLASLCRCPQYVWGPGREQRWTHLRMSNQQRYETLWNPLCTPCIYDDCGWRPPVDHIYDATRAALNRVGLVESLGPGVQRPHTGINVAWRLRRGLSRLMFPEAEGLAPWRVREFVRHRMV